MSPEDFVAKSMACFSCVLGNYPCPCPIISRTIGGLPGVVVVNSTAGGHASLMADVYCGDGTKLIFYMNPGEILSRAITSKDTHGTNGKLLVTFTEPERVDEGNQERVRATIAVLGFGSPSFSYGTDLVLPVELNKRLRQFLLDGHKDLVKTHKGDAGELTTRIIANVQGAFVPEVTPRLDVPESLGGYMPYLSY